MRKMCCDCKYWSPTIDNGWCEINIDKYCEYDNSCSAFTRSFIKTIRRLITKHLY
jgi:hypothetical protein